MTRFALSLPLLLALGACAPSEDGSGGSGGGVGPSPLTPEFELAMARNAPGTQSPVIDLSVAELSDRIASGQVMLVDVRRDEEVAQGMIPGAVHVPLDTFDPANLDVSDREEVILYCRSGRRSGIAAKQLAEHTGKPARHLAGGILAWEDAGKPVR